MLEAHPFDTMRLLEYAGPRDVDLPASIGLGAQRCNLVLDGPYGALRVVNLKPPRVVESQRRVLALVCSDVESLRQPNAGRSNGAPEHGVDERALTDSGIAGDDDVDVAQRNARS